MTALPALWAEIGVAVLPDAASGTAVSPNGGPAAALPLPPDRSAALALLPAALPPPSIVVWTGTAFQFYWLLAEPWVLETEDQRRQGAQVLRRVRWALASAAAAEGWRIDGGEGPGAGTGGDLAALMRLPGTFRHLATRPPSSLPVTVEDLPAAAAGTPDRGTPDGAPRRWTLADFDGLEEPPAGWSCRPFSVLAAPPEVLPRSAGCRGRIASPVEAAPPSPPAPGGGAPAPPSLPEPGDLRLEVVLRAAPGSRPAADRLSQLVAAAIEHLAGRSGSPFAAPDRRLQISPPAPQGALKPAAPDPSAAAAAAPGDLPSAFLVGLEELLAGLGGRATACQMVAVLAAADNGERFGVLRAALGRLMPELDGAAPTVRQLGYALRSMHGQAAGGRSLARAPKNAAVATWTVRPEEATVARILPDPEPTRRKPR